MQNNKSKNTTELKIKTTGPLWNARYKVKICKNWLVNGTCPYAEKCQFAHGLTELQKWIKRSEKKMHDAEEKRSESGSSVGSSGATPLTSGKKKAKTLINAISMMDAANQEDEWLDIYKLLNSLNVAP